MWEISLLAPVNDWFLDICVKDPDTADQIADAITILARRGPLPGRPLVDRIHGSKLHNLKELRPGSAGTSEIRMLFVFDAEREAIILVAGDKNGEWSRWYDVNIPLAEARYEQYIGEKDKGARA
ncbi:type II toxin-antitoxin system RelE/ParE family toxin [Kitasatospora aureofaciens]|uniref:type II toxin-antitoxin system RelE/ParE family toxin n=1 Tax=Kitasatospora aureofaciens TaxID=1894 RepID=UPI001C4762D5|nr:type II toxin-antitoxin system RelE/ParE family toxin [Kitasatospora aureofaciens]MBV6700977.1 type II toxin-antitoxin system RelE/ParE family toxin [Kitasatospora aureofaciens]